MGSGTEFAPTYNKGLANFSLPLFDYEMTIQLNTISEAVEAIRQGEVVIVVDAEERENEGDYICS